MRNKESKPFKIIRLPELQVGFVCKKIINWAAQVPYVYWLVGIIFLLALTLSLMPDNLRDFLWPRIKAQGTLISLVLIFCAVALSLVWKTGERLDVWVFMVFNVWGRRAPWFDWMMLGLTQLGNGVFALVIAIIFYLRADHLLAYEIILGTLTLWLIVELIKIIIRRTRPYIKLKNIRIIGSRARGHSFPSGHTSQSFFMATLMAEYFNIGIFGGLTLYAAALLVGVTRIYVGMHYPRDVLGGAVFGTAWGLLGLIVNNYIDKYLISLIMN